MHRESFTLICIVSLAALTGCGVSPEFRQEVQQASDVTMAPTSTNSVVGHWEGVGQQSNGSEWEIILDVTSFEEGRCARVSYPSIGCAGNWSCKGGSDGTRFDAVEHITKGKDRCVDEVAIRLHLDDDLQHVTFFAKGGGQRAAGRLSLTHAR